jgi:hypothetical protein
LAFKSRIGAHDSFHGKKGRPVEPVLVTRQEKEELERRISAPTVAKRDSERAEIILLRAQGEKQEEVASRLRCSSVKVAKWTSRFRRDGLEKSQCQALERTQRPLPMEPGHLKTTTHDYIRHGTITLFAALDYLHGKIFRRLEEKHTHVEWLRYLKQLHRETPPDLTLHLILDNYATHKKKEVRDWIDRRNRDHMQKHGTNRIELHFTPTSSSWMNLVERFFGDLSQQAVCNGSFQSVRELARRIEAYIAERDFNPKRYIWRAEGAQILAKIKRAREKLKETD